MAYFSITPAPVSLSKDKLAASIPLSYLNTELSSYYQSQLPFALQFSSFRMGAKMPYRLAILAPNLNLYAALNQEEFQNQVQSRNLHHHDSYEFQFVLDGELYQNIENRRHLYPAGSCCLLNRNIRHMEEYATDFRIANLSLSADFLTRLLSPLRDRYFSEEKFEPQSILEKFFSHEFDSMHSPEKNYMDFIPHGQPEGVSKAMHHLFDRLAQQILSPGISSTLIISGIILDILHQVTLAKNYDTNPIQIGSKIEAALFAQITRLMEETDGRIARGELEKTLNYSGSYLNQIVQKHTGLNIFHFGMTFCMKNAAYLLSHSTLSISEIAAKLKFSNRTHFYRIFESTYQLTPKAYRQKHRQNT